MNHKGGINPVNPMWSEKYRPESLDDIVGQEHIVERLRFVVERLHQDGDDAGFPHMMFAGRAGTGKTSVAVALMKSMFGEDWKANFIELNASDERSINVVRTTVKDFARRGTIGTFQTSDGRELLIPFNVVFLDECDNLTPDAQSALRRIMEKYSKQTRFILSCNYPNKVIAPIRDRCAFSGSRFRPIPSDAICEALKAIVEQEGLDIAPDALKAVGEASNGSMRSALNLLFSATRIPVRVEVEDVRELTNEISETGLKQMLGLAIESNKHDVGDAQYLKAHRRLDSMIERMGEKGMNGVEILDAFHSLVQNDSNVPNNLRRAIYKHIGEAIYWCSISQDDLLTVKTFLRRITV